MPPSRFCRYRYVLRCSWLIGTVKKLCRFMQVFVRKIYAGAELVDQFWGVYSDGDAVLMSLGLLIGHIKRQRLVCTWLNFNHRHRVVIGSGWNVTSLLNFCKNFLSWPNLFCTGGCFCGELCITVVQNCIGGGGYVYVFWCFVYMRAVSCTRFLK